jgi:hypothetical protein
MVGYADLLLDLSTDINGPANGYSSVRKLSRLPARTPGNLGSIPGGGKDLFLLYSVQTGSGAH